MDRYESQLHKKLSINEASLHHDIVVTIRWRLHDTWGCRSGLHPILLLVQGLNKCFYQMDIQQGIIKQCVFVYMGPRNITMG